MEKWNCLQTVLREAHPYSQPSSVSCNLLFLIPFRCYPFAPSLLIPFFFQTMCSWPYLLKLAPSLCQPHNDSLTQYPLFPLKTSPSPFTQRWDPSCLSWRSPQQRREWKIISDTRQTNFTIRCPLPVSPVQTVILTPTVSKTVSRTPICVLETSYAFAWTKRFLPTSSCSIQVEGMAQCLLTHRI